jgi:two-component system cell cycle sensor histidine kinase/response regulator CckA
MMDRFDPMTEQNQKLLREINERKQAELALRESEARYKSMFQDHPSVIYIHDPDTLLISDANPAACSFYGYGREEMVGMHLTKISNEPLIDLQKNVNKIIC